MRLVGHGHGAIRATHSKTLELSVEPDITARATCIVAVGVDEAGTVPLAGPVRIEISAGGHSFAFEAQANSSWDPGGPAVIRRSPFRRPGTLATSATAAAADLPRELVYALRDPATAVAVTVEPIRGRPAVVLCAVDPSRARDPRLMAEWAAADLVVAEDDVVGRATGERVGHGPVAVDGRVLVLAARELPGRTVVDALATVPVETVGLPGPLAAAAASPSRGPVVLVPDGEDAREVLRTAPARARVVVTAAADHVPALLELAADLRATTGAVIVPEQASPMRVRTGEPLVLPSRDPVHLCFDAAAASTALDPRVRRAIGALLAEGVPTRAAAGALAELTGWPRRQAYDAVIAWRADAPNG